MAINDKVISYHVLLSVVKEIAKHLELDQVQYEKLHKLLLSESGK